LGVEVEKAVMRVDFEEIEEVAQIAKEWQEEKERRLWKLHKCDNIYDF